MASSSNTAIHGGHDITKTKKIEAKITQDLNSRKRDKKLMRKAAGKEWQDETLDEWPENDYRIFCGDMGNEVGDDVLANAFKKFPSF